MQNKINKYLAGDLEGSELEQFEARLTQDSHLKAEVNRKEQLLEDSIREGVQYYHELESMIRDIHEKAQKEKANEPKEATIRQLPPKRNPRKWWVATAAAIALLIVSYFLLMKNQQPNQEQIIAQWENTVPIELPWISAGNSNQLEQLKANAETAFAAKQYSTAKNVFNQILQDTLIEKARLGKALCDFYLENYEAAIQDFEDLEASPVTFKTQATWLKGMTYLKQGNITTCITTLETLVNNKEASKKERENAQKLLQQLYALE